MEDIIDLLEIANDSNFIGSDFFIVLAMCVIGWVTLELVES